MALSEIRTQIYLERTQHEALKREAKRRRVSMAQVVREAVAAHLAEGTARAAATDETYLARADRELPAVAERLEEVGWNPAAESHEDLLYGPRGSIGLAEMLSGLTGETKGEAVTQALRDRLARLQRERSGRRLADELDEIALRCAARPVFDSRSEDEILGYGPDGLPG